MAATGLKVLDKWQRAGLAVLGKAAAGLRNKLGESRASVQSFNKPLEQATTSSLHALESYTRGEEQRRTGESILIYERNR